MANKKKLLGMFSLQELEAEISRRKSGVKPGAECYFKFADDEDDEYRVWFVKKRFWHLHHYIEDVYLADELPLPDDFHECQEALFEYDVNRNEANVIQVLTSLGYSELKDPSYNYTSTVKLSSNIYIDITADTQEIYEIISEVIEKKKKETNNNLDTNLEDFKSWLLSFLDDCVVVTTRTSTYSSAITIIKRSVYESLPTE